MAQKTVISYRDDLDGTEAAGTVRFGLGGGAYEIDLSEQNAARLEQALAPYIKAARKASPPRGPRRGGTGSLVRPDQGAVREWARAQGMKVSDRGRIPAEALDRYDAAH